ncbi:MAG: hypothetical protein AB8B74_03055 [Crocinitomicaceae bacterium]
MIVQRLIALFLASFMLLLIVRPSIQILSFYKDQANIISKYCVNKNEASSKCEGHCYLKKQLKATSQSSETDVLPEVIIYSPLAFTGRDFLRLSVPLYLLKRNNYLNFIESISDFSEDIFTPPKSAV